MKKIILSLSAILLLATVPSFAQNSFQKAKDTNAAGKSAVQSQSATDARNIGNQSWDCSAKGSGTPTTDDHGKTIDLIGGNENIDPKKDEKSCFDKNIVPADITPWKNEYKAMFATFIPSLVLALVAGMISSKNPLAAKIALGMAITAAAGFLAVLSLAVVIMTKYGQKTLGGMWIALATVGLALCAAVMAGGIDVVQKGSGGVRSVLTKYLPLITMGISLPLGIGMRFAHVKSNEINRKYQQEQICPANPDHEVCKPDNESSEHGNLML